MSNGTIHQFSRFLETLQGGVFARKLDDQLVDAVAAMNQQVIEDAKKGKAVITIQINLELDEGMVTAVPKLTVKTPEIKEQRSVFWTTPENNLSRFSTKQIDIENMPRMVRDAKDNGPQEIRTG